MSTTDGVSSQGLQFEVRWNRRSNRWNILFLFLVSLVYVAIAVRASGSFRIVGVAGTTFFGGVVLYGVAGARRFRRSPVAVTMNEVGV